MQSDTLPLCHQCTAEACGYKYSSLPTRELKRWLESPIVSSQHANPRHPIAFDISQRSNAMSCFTCGCLCCRYDSKEPCRSSVQK